jgi:hypothetical protein
MGMRGHILSAVIVFWFVDAHVTELLFWICLAKGNRRNSAAQSTFPSVIISSAPICDCPIFALPKTSRGWKRRPLISECLALKSSDVDWLSGKLSIERGIVRQRVDDLKTIYSGRDMSIDAVRLALSRTNWFRSDFVVCKLLNHGGSEWESNPPVTGKPAARRFWRPGRSPDRMRFRIAASMLAAKHIAA